MSVRLRPASCCSSEEGGRRTTFFYLADLEAPLVFRASTYQRVVNTWHTEYEYGDIIYDPPMTWTS